MNRDRLETKISERRKRPDHSKMRSNGVRPKVGYATRGDGKVQKLNNAAAKCPNWDERIKCSEKREEGRITRRKAAEGSWEWGEEKKTKKEEKAGKSEGANRKFPREILQEKETGGQRGVQ